MSALPCPVCENLLQNGLYNWHFTCPNCHYECSALDPVINSSLAHALIDEGKREVGLKAVRVRNFQTLLARIRIALAKHGSLLEVGCGHGWFLELARKDFEVVGIEPDRTMFERLIEKRLPVRCGYFPKAIHEQEAFDVIVFNDVIEHLPDIRTALRQCHQHLNENGLLVLNLPNSKGVFYQLSKWLARCSMKSFFNRLWQKDLPSPHLHYFNPANLGTLLERHGFELRESARLPTIIREGLLARISLAKGIGRLTQYAVYAAVLMTLPVLRFLPGDIFYCIAQRKPD